MAVTIKDMKMPSNCKECDIEVVIPLDGLIICGYTKGNNKSHHIFDRTKERRPDCPLFNDEQEQGYWIYNYDWQETDKPKYYCSKCSEGTQILKNFCPNCGAKMGSV